MYKEFRSIEEVYFWLYLDNIKTYEDRKEHEERLNSYLRRGFTQYEAMINLVVTNEKVVRRDDGMYVYKGCKLRAL